MKPFALSFFLLLFLTAVRPAHAQEHNPLINSGKLIDSGSVLFDSGQYKQSLALYRMVGRNDTNYARAQYESSLSYYADSQFNEAIHSCERAFQAETADDKLGPEIYNEYGNSVDAAGDPERSLLIFDTAISKYPAYGLLYLNKGIMLLELNRNKEAETVLEQAILVDPYTYSSHFELGLAALRQGKLIPAFLSLTGYLLLYPEGRHHGTCINLLSSIAHNADDIQKFVNERKDAPSDQYQLLEQIVQSKIALDENYKPLIHLDDPISRQIQVVFEKMQYAEGDNDFWMQYYVPYFKEVFTSNQFEPFINHIFASANLPIIQDYLKKNKKPIKDLIDHAADYFNQIRSTRELNEKKRGLDSTVWSFSDGKLQGRGKAFDNWNKLVGPWEFYYRYGNIRAKGTYDEQGKKQGPWNYYYFDGKLKGEEFYQHGKQEGEETYYFENGQMSTHSRYRNNLLEGESITYYWTGATHYIIQYAAGKEQGEKSIFFSNGPISYTEPYQAGQLEGLVRSWQQDGALDYTSEYRNGKQDGPYKRYYENGQLSIEGQYSNDKQEGVWKYYFENGKLKETQTFANGKQEGEDREYYENGQLYYTCIFRKGKINGEEPLYDEDGKPYAQLFFENDKLKTAKYMDKNGQTISQSESRQNQLDLTRFDAAGIKENQATYNQHGNAEGKFTYFYSSGAISQTETYQDGTLMGPTLTYFPDGRIKEDQDFSDGVKDGYTQIFYDHGQAKQEGWYVKDQAQGHWLYYDELGNLTDSIYFSNDEMDGYRGQFLPNGKKEFEVRYHSGWLEETTQYDSSGMILKHVSLPAGSGRYTLLYPSGATYLDANYIHGHLAGSRRSYYFDGKPETEQYFKNGLQDSIERTFTHSGMVTSETWHRMGNKIGTWKYYKENGKLSYTEEYKDGELNGKRMDYFSNGNIAEETSYKDDQKDGINKKYDESGLLIFQLTYKKGSPVSYTYQDKYGHLLNDIPIIRETGKIRTLYPGGTIAAELEFKDGYLDGVYTLYYPNGKIRYSSTEHLGDTEGPLKTYAPNGQLLLDYTYLHDNLHGHYKEYNEQGILTEEGNYYNGSAHGIVNQYDDNGKLKEADFYYYGKLLSVKK